MEVISSDIKQAFSDIFEELYDDLDMYIDFKEDSEGNKNKETEKYKNKEKLI